MINKNITNLRKQYKLSQEEVAEAIRVSRQAVAKWESGDSIPDAINCIALAELFQVTIDDLLRYDGEKTRLNLSIPPKGKHLFGVVTMGERGQIVIPKKARTVFDLNPGDELMILGDEEQGMAIIKADKIMEFMNAINSSIHKKD